MVGSCGGGEEEVWVRGAVPSLSMGVKACWGWGRNQGLREGGCTLREAQRDRDTEMQRPGENDTQREKQKDPHAGGGVSWSSHCR